jgi:hypothetical protein
VGLPLERGWIVEQAVPTFVDQRLRAGCFVHVGANLHHALVPGSAAIGPTNSLGRGDQAHGIPAGGDLAHDVVPQAIWGLSVEQFRRGGFRERFAGRLFSGEDVLDPEAFENSAGLERLTG